MGQHTTQDLTYQVDSRTVQGYLAVPERGEGPGVIVLHAWWGLTPFFKRLCDRLATAGFVAFAPDLNDGKTADTIEEAQQIISERNFELAAAVAMSAIAQIRTNAQVQGSKLGIIGFSMGAAWALDLSASTADEIAAVVVFYGTNDVDFAATKAAFLGHYAEHDEEWEPLANVQQMEADMRAAGRDVQFFIYPGTTHWFFEDDRHNAYNSDAAHLAWERTVTFLDDHLRQ